jgi:transposase
MDAYSEDLTKKKIVEAVERGMPKAQAARFFGVGISSVKRYLATASWCAGERLHDLADAQAAWVEPKKDAWELRNATNC